MDFWKIFKYILLAVFICILIASFLMGKEELTDQTLPSQSSTSKFNF